MNRHGFAKSYLAAKYSEMRSNSVAKRHADYVSNLTFVGEASLDAVMH
jgi:hypothetical protein